MNHTGLHKGISAIPFILAAFLLLLAAGCSSTESERVNEAIITLQRSSSSSDKDFDLARSSRRFLVERDEDYRIGSGDILEISIFELEKQDEFKTVETRVEESGEISLPVVGSVQAGGITVGGLEQKINDVLVHGNFIKNPRISVVVKEFRSKKITVLGAVTTPGEYMIRRNATTLLDIMGMAGGPTEDAGYELYVIRAPENEPVAAAAKKESAQDAPRQGSATRETITVDLISLMEEGNLDLNVVLRNGDVVYVPKAKQFYVVGYVRKPGGFPLTRPMTVLQGIAMAEGLMADEASPRYCALKRISDGMEEVLPLDLVAIAEGKSVNFYLEPDDIIDVRQTGWKSFRLRALQFIERVFHFGYTYDLNPKRY